MINNIILNIPHSSTIYNKEEWEGNIETMVNRWTDWYTDLLFKSNDKRCISVIFPYNRFYCDAERLINDPMNEIGQGICYQCFNGIKRNVDTDIINNTLDEWHKHQNNLIKHLNENSLLIDCHSFPSDISDVDICIGYNNDWSKPSNTLLNNIKEYFESHGYRVGINNPYSNSITPKTDFKYKSVMIEINKKIYLRENNEKNGFFYKINNHLNYLYKNILEQWNC